MTNALPALMCAETSEGAATRYVGAILGLFDDVLQGWAANVSTPGDVPVVEVFIDGASIALARADQYEPIANAPHQFCGFTVQLRRDWLDNTSAISVGIANTNVVLPGTIKLPIVTTTGAAAVASQLWHTGGLRVAGWSWDPQDPTRHVTLRVKERDEVVCEVVCNEPHQALAYRDSCDHGFTIDLPWALADGQLHSLTVEDDKGQSLAGSPITLCCRPEGLEGVIRALGEQHDPAQIALLKSLAQDASLRLPKSVGLRCYPEWYEVFQKLTVEQRPGLQNTIGVLVLTDETTTTEKVATTKESIGQVPPYLLEIVTAARSDVAPMLKQLVENGCASVLPIQAGDRLATEAIHHLGTLLDDGSAWGFADCDQDGPKCERTNPWFKPIWDLDHFIGADIFTPGSIFSSALVKQVLRSYNPTATEQRIDWDFFLAMIVLVTEQEGKAVAHSPRILYHRSMSLCASPEQQPFSSSRFEAITWLCNQLAPGARLEKLKSHAGLFRAEWPLPDKLPRVSLIVPTRDQFKLLKTCVEGLLHDTDYPDLEIIVMDNQSSDVETIEYLGKLRNTGVLVIAHPHPFNYSTINNKAAKHASGEVIGLINNDIEILDKNWLKSMVAQLMQPNVGLVGAKLLWPNHMVQHGGVVTGINGLAAHTGNNLRSDDAGYLATNLLTRQQSAVTAACWILEKKTYEALEGLNEIQYPVAFNDVDFCMRLRSQGKKIIWDASAVLIHAESASRGKDLSSEKKARAHREQSQFFNSWFANGQMDPYYSPSLSVDYLSGPYNALALPPSSDATRHQYCLNKKE